MQLTQAPISARAGFAVGRQKLLRSDVCFPKLERHGAEVEHPLSSRNGELSEKAGLGCRGHRLSGPGKGRLGAGETGREKTPARKSRLEANGYIFTTAGRPKN